jgi:hypothetical protein
VRKTPPYWGLAIAKQARLCETPLLQAATTPTGEQGAEQKLHVNTNMQSLPVHPATDSGPDQRRVKGPFEAH